MKRLSKVHAHVRLPANARGRDFVVGDLHGHLVLFERELARLDFDPATDRVLSVGDLVDRGPESLATLALIEQPWFHAVLGNHELMLLNYLRYHDSRTHSRRAYETGGGAWIVEALRSHRKAVTRLADAVAVLPLAIHVDGELPFSVMHSDLYPIGAPRRPEPVCVHLAEAATASRTSLASAPEPAWLELPFGERTVRLSPHALDDRVVTYVGHSRMRHVTVHRSFVYVDQGVAMPTPKRPAEVRPTVLDHHRFARWLQGVARALSARPPAGTGPGHPAHR